MGALAPAVVLLVAAIAAGADGAGSAAECGDPGRDESLVLELIGDRRGDDAESYARRSLAACEDAWGRASHRTADALDLLATVRTRAATLTSPETLSIARRAAKLRAAVSGRHSLKTAASLYRLATAQYYQLRFDEARASYERSLEIRLSRLGEEHADVAENLTYLGALLEDMGQRERARELLERSIRIREAIHGPNHPEVAEGMNHLANFHYNGGEYEAALELHRRVLGILEKSGVEAGADVGRSLYNVALTLQILGRYDEARILYERSLRLTLESVGPTHPRVAISRGGLAGLLEAMGDYAGAAALYDGALDEIEAKMGAGSPFFTDALMRLAVLQQKSGDLEAAERNLRRAANLRREAFGPDHVATAESDIWLARLLQVRGDHERAGNLLREAFAIQDRSLDPSHPDRIDTLVILARNARAIGDLESADEFLARALRLSPEVFGDGHPSAVEPLVERARVLEAMGRLEDARESLRLALDLVNRTPGAVYTAESQLLAHDARLLLFLSRTDEALVAALRGEALGRDHVRTTAGGLPEREALLYARSKNENLDIALSAALSGDRRDGGPFEQVWDAVVRSRAIVLDEMAARHGAALVSGDPETRRLAAELRDARTSLARLSVRGPVDVSPTHHARLVERAQVRKERAERELAAASAEFRERLAANETGLQQVRNALKPHEALIAFTRFSRVEKGTIVPAYAVFAVSSGQGSVLAVDLGDAGAIDRLVSRWRAETTRAYPVTDVSPVTAVQGSRRTGEALRRRIWDPVLSRLAGVERLYVVQDGSLHHVNLAALPYGEGLYLVETGPAFHYLSAERDLVAARGKITTGNGLLALGGADFAAVDARAARDGSKEASPVSSLASSEPGLGGIQFEPLPSSAREVEEIAGLWGEAAGDGSSSIVLTGGDASEASFKRLSPGRRVLHLATHGFFLVGEQRAPEAGLRGVGGLVSGGFVLAPDAGDSPLLRAGLALAGANRRADAGEEMEDGILTAEEIAALDLVGVEWAVLSACDTGVGEVQAGEGVLGLQRSFRIAGARTVIMSLWPVEDEAARAWMRDLYRARFERGLDTVGAVREATLAALERDREANDVAHPFRWGGFVAVGDGR